MVPGEGRSKEQELAAAVKSYVVPGVSDEEAVAFSLRTNADQFKLTLREIGAAEEEIQDFLRELLGVEESGVPP